MKVNEPEMISDRTFADRVLDSHGLVLVNFTGEKCEACDIASLSLEKLRYNLGDRIALGKLDVNANSLVTDLYNIQSIPTVMLFKDGKLEKTFKGVQSESRMRAWLDTYI